MEEGYSNKGLLLTVGIVGIVVAILIALSPLYAEKTEWDSSITWAGTFCSIIGIAIAIIQIYGVQKATTAVRDAVSETKRNLKRNISLSDLSKYFEVVNTTIEDIQQKEYKQAQRSMKRLQDAIIEFREVPLEEIQIFRYRISEAISKIGSDIEYIQIHLDGSDGFNQEVALHNLNKIQQLLSEIKAKLKHR